MPLVKTTDSTDSAVHPRIVGIWRTGGAYLVQIIPGENRGLRVGTRVQLMLRTTRDEPPTPVGTPIALTEVTARTASFRSEVPIDQLLECEVVIA